jgi:2,3-bisphosphoglycerate-independent phosphoglycerate mutase
MNVLKKSSKFPTPRGPVVLAIMDGSGHRQAAAIGDMVASAFKPSWDWLKQPTRPTPELKAHGTAVGMPSDADMGNSEVGHNAIGCGPGVQPGRQPGRERHQQRRAV